MTDTDVCEELWHSLWRRKRAFVVLSQSIEWEELRSPLILLQLALPHMRQIVKNTYGRPINIDLLEKLQLPSSSTNTSTANTITQAQLTNTSVVVNPSLLTQQQHGSPILQQPLYTTVQPQQKINLLQQASQSSLIGSTASLLSQQQQQQQQARTQIVCEASLFHSLYSCLSPHWCLEHSGHSSIAHLLVSLEQHQSLQRTATACSTRGTNDHSTFRYTFPTIDPLLQHIYH